MFSSLPRGICGVEMGMGTPPLIVPLRYAGLDEGLRLMVAVLAGGWYPGGAVAWAVAWGSVSRLTVEVGRLDWENFLNCRLRSEFRGMVEDLSKLVP